MKKFITKTKQNYFVSENVNSILKRNALLRLSCVLNKLRTICKRICDAYASTDYTEEKKKPEGSVTFPLVLHRQNYVTLYRSRISFLSTDITN